EEPCRQYAPRAGVDWRQCGPRGSGRQLERRLDQRVALGALPPGRVDGELGGGPGEAVGDDSGYARALVRERGHQREAEPRRDEPENGVGGVGRGGDLRRDVVLLERLELQLAQRAVGVVGDERAVLE